ncbi:MAG: DUF3842 family protein [Clostridiaceae bacterium]
MTPITILVLDGQGGRIGKQVIEGIRARLPEADIAAVGTNSIATSTMMKAGATRGGTGENAVIVNCRTADLIVGPLGIVIADSMMGEISPAMAVAVGQSPAERLLIPMKLCKNVIVGASTQSVKDLIALAVDEVEAFCK